MAGTTPPEPFVPGLMYKSDWSRLTQEITQLGPLSDSDRRALLEKGEPTLMDVVRIQMSLHYDMADMREDIGKLLDKMDTLSESLESNLDVHDKPDNHGMKAEEIKNLILKEYDLSKPTYPSDVADKHGLDYDEVLAAVELLRKEGQVEYDK